MAQPALEYATVEDLLAQPREARAELIDGHIVHKALPSAEHSFCQRKLSAVLDPFDRMGGGSGPSGWWIGTETHVIYPDKRNGFLHDLAGWRRDKHQQRPSGSKIVTIPDWVCEIVSTNRRDDLVRKKRILHNNRVAHYWTIDHRDEVISVMRWVEGGYLIVADAARGEKVRLEPFEDIEIETDLLFGIT